MFFRKNAVVVEATQWFKNGDHPLDYSHTHTGAEGGEIRHYAPAERKAKAWEGDIVRYYRRPDDDGERLCEKCGGKMHDHGWIDTLEGGHIVCPGDWIITGVKGEHYPCKPDIFEMTYTPASEDDVTDRHLRDLFADFIGRLYEGLHLEPPESFYADTEVARVLALFNKE
jgi:hypothetical protein